MVKSTFSIKDLENLSGIKAHTIRIWEKRYDLLQPDRSDTNIRNYDLAALQKLLNVCYLKESGSKISTIASLTEEEIEAQVKYLAEDRNIKNLGLQKVKLAMVNFDKTLFHQVFDEEVHRNGFKETFEKLIIPFLEELGNLWHSNTINIAHEHFISNLIKQKLLIEIEMLERSDSSSQGPLLVLFLPENEMHDLGLLFLNYQLLKAGYRTVYLGASMLLDSLTFFQRNDQQPIFITFVTVSPKPHKILTYLKRFDSKLNNAPLLILGRRISAVEEEQLPSNQKTFRSIEKVLNHLEEEILV